jgi:hypothetical protein
MGLVVFRSKAAGEIFMLPDTARRILEIVGKKLGDDSTPGAQRGVLTTAEIADALQRLEAAVQKDKANDTARPPIDRGADPGTGQIPGGAADEPVITLGQRAFPLLEMLRTALKARADITWGV